MKVVVTIPAYNEEKTIDKVIKEIKQIMVQRKYDHHILVLDDGSKDSTRKISESLGAKVFSHTRNLGLAETFRSEIKQSLVLNADIIVHIDADGQYLPKEIPLLIEQIQKGNDLVLGSRFLGKIESMPLIKKMGNRAFSRVISQIIRMKITDAQTGFRAFTSEVAKQLNITSTHTYTQEQIIRAAKANFKIKEVPVYFAKRGGKTKSRLMKNSFEFAIKAWINLIRVYRDHEPLKFFGFVGLFFFLLGFILGIFIFVNYFTTGSVGAIPRVILTSLLILTGIQIWIFGFLADMLKKE